MRPQASIVAIGTEVASGDVINSNAAWLARQLTALGFRVPWHVTVEDERVDMLRALDSAASAAAESASGDAGTITQIFVIGGLGPTSDDFTRNVVGEWLSASDNLEFRDASWQRILAWYAKVGLQPPESNRQQCFFPKSSQVYPNELGTADAFSVVRLTPQGQQQVWCLPGPPRELQFIWNTYIQKTLAANAPAQNQVTLELWQCLGQGESALGELVESTLQGSGLKTGYRARPPYVDIKVWYQTKDRASALRWINRLTKALEPWAVERDSTDLAEKLIKMLCALDKKTIVIRDGLAGVTAERLMPKVRAANASERIVFAIGSQASSQSVNLPLTDLFLSVDQVEKDEKKFYVQTNDTRDALPSRFSLTDERGRAYAVERAIVHWLQNLQRMLNPVD